MHKQVTGVALVALLTGLPGCWFANDKNNSKETTTPAKDMLTTKQQAVVPADNSTVLVLMDGNPIVTVDSLEREKAELLEANPQFKDMLPKSFDRNLAEGITNQAIVDKYIIDNKINATADYEKTKKRMEASVVQMLNNKFFQDKITVDVSDAEIQKFYDDHKDNTPQLLISHGGTKAVGVQFNTQEAAQAFLAKAIELKGNVQKAAEADKVKVQNFNLVNEQSIGLNPQLRDKILAIKKVPNTEIIKVDDKAFWVVQATEKQEAKYQPLAHIKQDIAKHLEQDKRTRLLEEEIKKLRDQYKVEFKAENFAADDQKEQEFSAEDFQEALQK